MDNFDHGRAKDFGGKVFLIVFSLVLLILVGAGAFVFLVMNDMNSVRSRSGAQSSVPLPGDSDGKTTIDRVLR